MAVLIAAVLVAPGWAATKHKAKVTKRAAKPAAKAAAPKTVTRQSVHFTIKSDLPQPAIDAILAVSEASLDGYRDLFGLYLYPNPNPGDKRIVISAKKAQEGVSLRWQWDRKPAEVALHVPGVKDVALPPQAWSHLVFIYTRGFAYPLASYDNEKFNAGLMDYLGAHVVDYVAAKFDAEKMPRPDDWVETSGTGQFPRWEAATEPGDEAAAAMLLYKVANEHGKETVGKALRLVAMSKDPMWQAGAGSGVHPRTYKVAALCQQLVDMTGNGEIAQWFRESRFPSVVDPLNITGAELWSQKDETARCRLLCDRWGGNGVGLLDGKQVVLVGRFDEQKRGGATEVQKSVTVEGVVLKAIPGAVASVWYQPETRRIYVAGKVKLGTGGTLENEAMEVPGQPAPPSAPAK